MSPARTIMALRSLDRSRTRGIQRARPYAVAVFAPAPVEPIADRHYLRRREAEEQVTTSNLVEIARAIVADAKGVLAADETVGTITRRLAKLTIDSTADSRRDYREMFFTTPGVAEFIGGVILHDETIRQKSADGTPLVDLLTRQGIIPGIKVDNGVKPLAGWPGEFVTEGLDGLRER